MSIGTKVTFNIGWGDKSGEIVWISDQFAWIKDEFENTQKIELSKIQISQE
jgi:hypothetical protein